MRGFTYTSINTKHVREPRILRIVSLIQHRKELLTLRRCARLIRGAWHTKVKDTESESPNTYLNSRQDRGKRTLLHTFRAQGRVQGNVIHCPMCLHQVGRSDLLTCIDASDLRGIPRASRPHRSTFSIDGRHQEGSRHA